MERAVWMYDWRSLERGETRQPDDVSAWKTVWKERLAIDLDTTNENVLPSLISRNYVSFNAGSSDPIGSNFNNCKISFYPYLFFQLIFIYINLQYPYHLSDPDNFKIANRINTPTHIKPEWYLLFAYSILTSLILYITIFYNNKFNLLNKIYYWFFY